MRKQVYGTSICASLFCAAISSKTNGNSVGDSRGGGGSSNWNRRVPEFPYPPLLHVMDFDGDGYNELIASRDPYPLVFFGTPWCELVPGYGGISWSHLPEEKKVIEDINNGGMQDLFYNGSADGMVFSVSQQQP